MQMIFVVKHHQVWLIQLSFHLHVLDKNHWSLLWLINSALSYTIRQQLYHSIVDFSGTIVEQDKSSKDNGIYMYFNY